MKTRIPFWRALYEHGGLTANDRVLATMRLCDEATDTRGRQCIALHIKQLASERVATQRDINISQHLMFHTLFLQSTLSQLAN